jgi:spermidine synthase
MISTLFIITAYIYLIFFPSLSFAQENPDKTIYQKNSLYQYIAVIDDTHKRERYIIGNKRKTKDLLQGGIYIDKPEKLLFEYTQMSFIGLAFLDREPKQVLFIGLGAGSMPRYFHRYYPNVQIDIVEIDQDIHYVAKKYFHFKEKENMKTYIADGRVFIKRAQKKYDMIFLDAYQGDYIPFHLTTVEFLQEVKHLLKDDGIVIANIRSPYKNKLFYSMIQTYKEVFPYLYIFKGKKSRNYIFITTERTVKKDEKSVAGRAKQIQARKNFDIDLLSICRSFAYYTAYEREAKVLTDDFAPVNLYRYMKVDN